MLSSVSGVDILNIVGEYCPLEQLIINRLSKKDNGDTGNAQMVYSVSNVVC